MLAAHFFDTAALYGRGLSESMLGEALRQRPSAKDRLVITTKAGRTHDGCDFSFAGVQRSVYASLERMDLPRLPVVYIHDAMGQPPDFVLSQRGALGALRSLQQQGVIDHIGTAANDPATNLDYIKTGEFDCAVIADSWSLINRIAEREIFAAAARHDVGLVAATPLERGLLVNGHQENARYLNRRFSQACLDHVARIQRLCADYGVPMLAVALQCCARHPQVASTIPGARVPSEARSSMAAARLQIPERLWDDLRPLARHFDTAVSI
ncbi:MAG: aldo/keto reductase [Chloroflexi bacterium]|nr:aldo/keto reductase [Chloroflexota bacterium]MCY4248697.1 aldo/keto reductase [Chloroflexota bacterium]